MFNLEHFVGQMQLLGVHAVRDPPHPSQTLDLRLSQLNDAMNALGVTHASRQHLRFAAPVLRIAITSISLRSLGILGKCSTRATNLLAAGSIVQGLRFQLI
jgi:hypothetical protein